MTKLEEILTHPYKDRIEEMCLQDEPINKILSWVRNTIDGDDNIKDDDKAKYYLTYAKLSRYKKLLQEKAKDVLVQIKTDDQPITVTNVEIVKEDNNFIKKIIEEDSERNIINIYKTLVNLAKNIEKRMDRVEKLLDREEISAKHEKLYAQYVNTLRTLLTDISRITGYEDFYKKMGQNLGDYASKGVINEDIKNKLKKFIMEEIILELDEEILNEKLPKFQQKLEDILNGKG